MQTIKVQLSGGGLDSTAFTILNFEQLDMVVIANYGQLAYENECDAVHNVTSNLYDKLKGRLSIDDAYSDHTCAPELTPLKIINENSLLFGTGTNGFIRARNLHLALYAANRAIKVYGTEKPIELQFGLCFEHLMFSDANKDFITNLNKLLNLSYGYIGDGSIKYPLIQVSAPYIRVSKYQYLKLALLKLTDNGYTKEQASELLFDTSFTCWTPTEDGNACGVCYHCEKQASLMENLLQQGDL